MKRNIIVLLLSLVTIAAKANSISEEYAAKLASKLLGGRIESVTSSVNKAKSVAGKDKDQQAYYVFTGGNGKGFAIVSASDATMPILAYSQEGYIDEIPENMLYWLDGMEAQINEIRRQGIEPTEEIKKQWEQASVGNAKVKLTTAQWNQGAPYNGECPLINGKRAVTGCVATAYAILMKYYGSPGYGIGNTEPYNTETLGVHIPSRNLNHNYDWENMPMSYKSSYTASQGKAVAALMADIGSAIKIDYKEDETGGRIAKPGITVHFNYASGNHLSRKNYTSQQWHAMLQDELNGGAPILYDGGENGSRHAFVLDGYTDNNYYSVNWGWGGSYNGFFLLDGLTPAANTDYSGESWALLGFKPMDYVNEDDAIAVVDNRLCPDINTALAISNATHGTIKLLRDYDCGELVLQETEEHSLDLNGKCLNGIRIFNHGSLTVMDTEGNGKMINPANHAVFTNYGNLTILSGHYINTAVTYEGQNDYRRAVWTSEGSNTVIKGGTFTTLAGSQCLCFNGTVTIENGEFVTGGNGAVVSNYSTSGELIINGGTFTNNAATYNGQYDYRRAIWTSEGSNTIINDGTFTNAGAQCLCFNGTATIENGRFIHQGNNSVLGCYNTSGDLVINGGTFIHTATTYEGQYDYRRSIMLAEGTNAVINGGTFDCQHCPWNIISYGNVTINNADIDTPKGTDCYVTGDFTVKYARMSGKYNIRGNGNTVVYEGLFSQQVPVSMLAPHSNCVANDDISTRNKYPYVVTNVDTGAMDVEIHDTTNPVYYNLSGQIVSNPKHGSVVILHNTNGTNTKKILK